MTPRTLHRVLVPLKLPSFRPSWKKFPLTRSETARTAPSLAPGSTPRKSRGGAGASQPRSIKSKRSGRPVKTAAKEVSPATLEKRQKKTLFLCDGAHPKPFCAGGSQSSERSRALVVFSLLVLYLFPVLPFLLKKVWKFHSLVVKAHFWSSPDPHLISKHCFLCLQRNQQLVHGPYLNFSEAATHCLHDEFLERNDVTWTPAQVTLSRRPWGSAGLACIRPAYDLI